MTFVVMIAGPEITPIELALRSEKATRLRARAAVDWAGLSDTRLMSFWSVAPK